MIYFLSKCKKFLAGLSENGQVIEFEVAGGVRLKKKR